MKKQSTLVKHDSPLLPLGAMMCGIAMVAPIMPAQASEVDQKLKTVVVKDAKKKDTLNLNENNGYQATATRIGKSLQDPHDIPQGVTIVTRQLMDDQQAGSFKEALRNVSGLTFNAAEGGRAGDNIMLRGFTTYGDTYLDGVRDSASCRTRDGRCACRFFFFWTESMVREDERRRLLFDLDMNILALRQQIGDTPEVVKMTSTYHNLLRMWAET